jgi:hypothetical protein
VTTATPDAVITTPRERYACTPPCEFVSPDALLSALAGQRLYYCVLDVEEWQDVYPPRGEYLAVLLMHPAYACHLDAVVLLCAQRQPMLRADLLTPPAAAERLALWLRLRRPREVVASPAWAALLSLHPHAGGMS